LRKKSIEAIRDQGEIRERLVDWSRLVYRLVSDVQGVREVHLPSFLSEIAVEVEVAFKVARGRKSIRSRVNLPTRYTRYEIFIVLEC